ncbi:unnamed protein product [Urochloa humidicola]
MAALRSALAMLSRGSSRSPAAAYAGGRGMGINQVFRRAAPPLHPPAIGNAEGCRRFSTGMRKLLMWRQWAKDCMKNAPMEDRNRLLFVYSVFVLGTPAVYLFKTTSFMLRS